MARTKTIQKIDISPTAKFKKLGDFKEKDNIITNPKVNNVDICAKSKGKDSVLTILTESKPEDKKLKSKSKNHNLNAIKNLESKKDPGVFPSDCEFSPGNFSEIDLKPFEYDKFIKKCPICNKSLKSSWVQKSKTDNSLKQIFRCMRKKCGEFYKEVIIEL